MVGGSIPLPSAKLSLVYPGDMSHQAILSQIVSNITTVIELAPAAKKDPEQLTDLIFASSEFRVAARMLRDLPPHAESDEIEQTKIDSPLDERVAYVRKMLTETREHFEKVDVSKFEEQHAVALETMLGGAVEMSNNIRQLAA